MDCKNTSFTGSAVNRHIAAVGLDNMLDDGKAKACTSLLSPTGPSNGLVVSPLDGEIPERIAIVQGHSDDDEAYLLSSLILGVNESILALDKTKGLEVVLISPSCQPFQDGFLPEAKKVSGLQIIEGIPQSVERKQEGEPLTLNYDENGKQKKETFELIVVLTKQKISPELVSLSKKFEQEIV